MSSEAIAWARTQKVGNGTGKAILLYLAIRANPIGAVFVDQEEIALECECTSRAVRTWIAALSNLGLILRSKRRDREGRQLPDEIVLKIVANAVPAERGSGGRAERGSGAAGTSFRHTKDINKEINITPKSPSTRRWVRRHGDEAFMWGKLQERSGYTLVEDARGGAWVLQADYDAALSGK